jgi:hypothetical protein
MSRDAATDPRDADELMQQASEALTRMDYAACERLCLRAMPIVRRRKDWAYYSRILLPLQEARRQRRMLAAEGTIRLGSKSLEGVPGDWLERFCPGGIVLTHPHEPEQADELNRLSRQAGGCLIVLYADNPVESASWVLIDPAGALQPPMTLEMPAPPQAWQDRDWTSEHPAPGGQAGQANSPADWLLNAGEALGDACLERVEAECPQACEKRVEMLEACLSVVSDHELLHQRLGALCRLLSLTQTQG